MTDENGCAVLANLDSGPQTLTYSAPGYVDKDSNPAPSKQVTIGAGTIAQASGSYDVAATINTTIKDDATPTPNVATWPSVALDHAQRSTPTLFSTLTGGTANASTTVFPFSSSYKAFVGNCTGNDPSNTLYTNAGAAPGTQVDPGQTKSVTLTMRNVTVNLGSSSAAAGTTPASAPTRPRRRWCRQRRASPAPASSRSRRLPTAPSSLIGPQPDASGKITFLLPYGVWRVCATKFVGSPTNRWFQVKSSAWSSSSNPADESPTVTTSTTTGNYAADLLTTLTYPGTGTTSAPSTSTSPMTLRRLRSDQSGFSLVELLMSMALGVDRAHRPDSTVFLNGVTGAVRTSDRVEALQRGRVTMDRVVTLLNSQICLLKPDGTGQPPILDGQNSSVTFYATLGAVDSDPTIYRVRYDSGTKRLYEEQFLPFRSGQHAHLPDLSGDADSSRVIGTNIPPTTAGAPIFKYWQFVTTAGPTLGMVDTTPLSPPLSSTAQFAAVRMTICSSPSRSTRPAASNDVRATSLDGVATVEVPMPVSRRRESTADVDPGNRTRVAPQGRTPGRLHDGQRDVRDDGARRHHHLGVGPDDRRHPDGAGRPGPQARL